MLNRTVPAAAEGMPKHRRPKSPTLTSTLELLGYDAFTIEIMHLYSQMTPEEKRAMSAATSAVERGIDPTAEIVAAVGAERADRFVVIWRLFVEDAAEKAEAAR